MVKTIKQNDHQTHYSMQNGWWLGFLGIISVVLILYAGFMWMTAAGNEDKVGQAKKLLVAAVIGLIIILASYSIASFVLDVVYRVNTN